MNCPECHIPKEQLSDRLIAEWDGKDLDVEMEDKGKTGKTYQEDWEDGKIASYEEHLYQCPVCKNIEIQ